MALAVVKWTDDNRIAKYQELPTLAAAQAHVGVYGGFAVDDPGGSWRDWLIDPVAKTVSLSTRPPPPKPPVPAALQDIPASVVSVPALRDRINGLLALMRGG